MAELNLDIGLDFGAFALDAKEETIPLRGVTALFGPSGSGKTTVLRIVAGLERQARGRIAFDGTVWQDDSRRLFVPPHRRAIGYVFQDARLFDHLSVGGNLAYARRRGGGADETLASEVVGALDLEPLLKRRPAALSGGERQRVAIGRALLTRPALLLMDEPLSALDLRRRAEIIPYIEALPRRFGVPVLYVTHAIEEVARMSDDMVVLADGRFIASGPAEDVMERLDLQPLAGHFEAGVLLDGEVPGPDEGFAMTEVDLGTQEGGAGGGQKIRMPGVDVPVGQRVRLRVRARDVSLATSRPENISIRNILSGRVLSLVEEEERAFAETLIDIGGQHLRARLTREAVAALGLEPGAEVYALIKSIAFDRRLLPS
ncbi:MAG: molybdenum ABC transporter ATP-binding protein [Bauldia litoralis]